MSECQNSAINKQPQQSSCVYPDWANSLRFLGLKGTRFLARIPESLHSPLQPILID